jgi:glycosyltransferase involved in cell wall biosynthesis
MQVTVSVVMPNFNNSEYIGEAINSVLNQSFKDFELIVVDDGSTDNSLQVIRKYGSRIRFISQSNSGVAVARNTGILESRGKIIALLDSDDVWHSEKLQKQLAQMSNSGLDLVYSGGFELENGVRNSKEFKPKYAGQVYEFYKKHPTEAVILLGGSSAIFKKSILSKVGLFNPTVPPPTEDWDFFRRVGLFGFEVGFCSEALVGYRIHTRNASRGSLDSYFSGNKASLLEMFVQDSSISFFERRRIWMKFLLLFIKSNVKTRKFINVPKDLIQFVKPLLP